MAESADPRRVKERMLSVLPSMRKSITARLLPNRPVPSTESTLPRRTKPRMLKADESVTSWPTDIVWAKDARPNKETVEPSRVKARSDKLDPRQRKSRIVIDDPSRDTKQRGE